MAAGGRAVQEHCPGVNNQPYVCVTGHCCGETGCCTYYYELWWFWLLWTVLILLSCCCAYRHRRAKLRVQQQQRQREINLIAYHRACHYSPSMLDLRVLPSFKLPAYDEVAYRPTTPPPPYSSILNQLAYPSSSVPSEAAPASPSDSSGSCSCASGCLISESSSSFSGQVTNETGTSLESTSSDDGSWLQSPEEDGACGKDPCPNKQASFSSYVDFFDGGSHSCWDIEEEDEEEEEEHYRHRRLTGDSGIEVCRCQIQGQVQDEEEVHDSPACTERSRVVETSEKGGSEPEPPVQPV
ncbi:WW domain-binding protein 1 [Bombina bombina]|uniref:WW domain-binding protein 1 n=1 Tax=Bombina bombina TaxID=8345 RepID=UPI00235A50FA|nr:WW domain-binding protein 1 [Bombina bombina]